MSTYQFMEVALHEPQNRNKYLLSKQAIGLPFLKENRRIEMWRSMFLYRTENPEETDPMFGNFYLECDIPDFQKNRDVMLEVATYLQQEFKIPLFYLDFFYTNRSIWISVPAKVFGCFGSIKLNLIYKKMAEQVQEHLDSKGYPKALDLSIYKWNGLIHSLGSFLKKSNRWVTKFSQSDLEEAISEEEVLKATYDNFSSLNDVTVVETAKEWYQVSRISVLYNANKAAQNTTSLNEGNFRRRPCMERLEEMGTIEENRNLHIYSYSLYLKEQGYSTQEAIEKVQSVFAIDYVDLRECHRTVKSAIEGSKHFNCTVVKQLLNPDLFDCGNCSIKKTVEKPTFIVPRQFIKQLQEANVHYDTYKYLLYILKEQQENKESYVHSLKGEKHKKLVVSRFQKLENLNIIKLKIEKEELICQLVYVDLEVYKSHIVLPKSFLTDTRFKEMKSEIKVLMELWRSSILTGKEKKSLFFNVRLDTLRKQLGMSFTQLMKHFYILKKKRLIFGNRIFIFFSKKEIKDKLQSIVHKVKERLHKFDSSFLMENEVTDMFPIEFIEKNTGNKNQIEIFSSGLLSIV